MVSSCLHGVVVRRLVRFMEFEAKACSTAQGVAVPQCVVIDGRVVSVRVLGMPHCSRMFSCGKSTEFLRQYGDYVHEVQQVNARAIDWKAQRDAVQQYVVIDGHVVGVRMLGMPHYACMSSSENSAEVLWQYENDVRGVQEMNARGTD